MSNLVDNLLKPSRALWEIVLWPGFHAWRHRYEEVMIGLSLEGELMHHGGELMHHGLAEIDGRFRGRIKLRK